MICHEDDMEVERNLSNQDNQGNAVVVDAIAFDRSWSRSAMITGLRMPWISVSFLSIARHFACESTWAFKTCRATNCWPSRKRSCISKIPIVLTARDRKSTRLNSSHVASSYAVFRL